VKEYFVSRLVKSEDLNHHGTLFAGRTAEWFVESSFIAAAATVGHPENVVCVNIHGMQFKSAVSKGDIICFKSRIAYVGKTSIIVYTKLCSETKDITPVEGFVSFVHVDENSKTTPHNLILDETNDPEELDVRAKAKVLAKK
jgi:acyl-CoA hydrolase